MTLLTLCAFVCFYKVSAYDDVCIDLQGIVLCVHHDFHKYCISN